jgi:thioredoxin-like negative regulator of GroEL
MRAIALTLLLLALGARTAGAQHDAHPMGPAKLGTVHFATSCRAEVAPAFDRAVALLHSFEFGEAIPAFQQIATVDPTCAMAHWGIALGYWSNPLAPGARSVAQLEAGRNAVARARSASAHASARERAYIDAVGQLYARFDSVPQRARVVAYEHAMQQVAQSDPDDSEAQIFHALALLAAADPADKTYANQLAAAATLERLYASHPDHPG